MTYKESKVQVIPCLAVMKTECFNLYVGPRLSWLERRKLRKVQTKYKVIYLYDYFDKLFKKDRTFNFPGVAFPDTFSPQTIFEAIAKSEGVSIDLESKNIIRYDGQNFVILNGTSSLDLAISYLSNHGLVRKVEKPSDTSDIRFSVTAKNEADIVNECKEDIRFRVTSDENIVEHSRPNLYHYFDVLPSPGQSIKPEKARKPIPLKDLSAKADETKQSIMELLQSGFPVQIIKSWIEGGIKLSRLRITRQYRILLLDYDLEIELGPLPKTVFLFYLLHPEGVEFKCLQDHAKELREIYGHLSVNDNPSKMDKSIEALVNPLKNSINEKCAAIKSAFMEKICLEVAQNYYVQGPQGGLKRISLDRSLVEWECCL